MDPSPAAAAHDLDLDTLDLTDPGLFAQGFPHHVFSRLRSEAAVWRQPETEPTNAIGGRPFWVLSRHADVQATNRDPETFSPRGGPGLQLREEMSVFLTNLTGAAHARQRRLISAGFTPRMVGRLEQNLREWSRKIFDDALERETVDFVEDVAYQLPMHLIADVMGIPVEDRRPLFTTANTFLQSQEPARAIPESRQQALQLELFQYGQRLSAAKRANPQDDVWTRLTLAEYEAEDGSIQRLEGLELDMFFIVLILAGSETTRNAITGGLLALLEHCDQLERLRHEPSLMKDATEEILRWSSPVSYFMRTATRDTEIRGVPIAEGDIVTMWYASANRDAEVFEDPFRFDITRQLNHHVSFGGGGPHFCLGAHLARREISTLFEELLRRVEQIELLGDVEYSNLGIGSPIVVSPRALPVRLKAR
jgi:cytochrome P450